jgi:hypothetical protein
VHERATRPGPRERRRGRARDDLTPLTVEPALGEERAESARQADGLRRVRAERLLESDAEILALLVEPPASGAPFLGRGVGRIVRQLGEVREVASDCLRRESELLELLSCVLADRLEHPEPHPGHGRRAGRHEARVDEGREQLLDIDAAVDDRAGCIDRETSAEHGEGCEEPPCRLVQQVVAPADRAAERAMTLVGVARAAGEIEPPAKPCVYELRGDEPCLRGGQLDGEGKPVEGTDDCRNDLQVGIVRRPAGRRGAGREQAHGIGSPDCVRVTLAGGGKRERRDAEDVLSRDVEPRPARRQHGDPCSAREEIPHRRCRSEHVLHVVEHEKHLARGEVLPQGLGDRGVGAHRDSERLRNGGEHLLGVGERGEQDGDDTVRKSVDHTAGRLEGQSRLADPTRARERHEAHVPPAEQLLDRREVLRAPDEAADRGRDRDVPARDGRSLAGEPLRDEQREVVAQEVGQLVRGLEASVGDAARSDSLEHALQPRIALTRGTLDVHELRYPRPSGELVLVLETGDLHSGGHPSVPLPVDPDEDVALLEVGAVQRPRWMRTRSELEEDGDEPELLDRAARSGPLRSELLEGGRDEHPEPLVGRQDACAAVAARVLNCSAEGGRATAYELPIRP